MGAVLEMMTVSRLRIVSAAIVAAVVLSGCGSDKDATAGARVFSTAALGMIKGIGKKPAPGTGAPQVTREQLAALGQPVIQAELESRGITTLFVPLGLNNGVETWSTADDRTVSFRQGMMVATRGFGPDIMQSSGPSLAQIAQGSGNHDRSYYYLDGADQTQRFNYACSLANLGAETITVVGKQHTARHISESCTGKGGSFVNEYWIENGSFLRQSKQLLIPGWGHLTFKRVID